MVGTSHHAQAMQQPAPDNTATNKQDQATAEQQGQTKNDPDITKRIRREVMKVKTLSTYARNIKIITQDGVVTLKGPVRSQEEKDMIERIATSVAGEKKVVNEIKLAPKSDT